MNKIKKPKLQRAEEYEAKVKKYIAENINPELNINFIVDGFPTFKEIPFNGEITDFTSVIYLLHNKVNIVLENGKVISYSGELLREKAMDIIKKEGYYQRKFIKNYGRITERKLKKNALNLMLQTNMFIIFEKNKKAYWVKRNPNSISNLWKIAIKYAEDFKGFTLVER